MLSMQSFGLWYKKRTYKDGEEIIETGEVDFSLHINFWFLEDIRGIKTKIKYPYIDIGVKIKNYKGIEGITFYCPFEISENNIVDLSQKMSTKSNATMVFNDECEIKTINSYTCVTFSDDSKSLLFLMDEMIEDTYRIESMNGNSRIIFDFSNFHKYVEKDSMLNEINDLYIRFRIKDIDLKDKIYFDSEPLNKSFESAFSGTRVLDFKINEKRNIDEKLQAKMVVGEQQWAEFSKVHFLVMEPSSYDLTSFSNYDMSCRELEENMWDDYLDAEIDFSKGHVLAYHWKGCQQKEIGKRLKDFSCFAKINYSKMQYPSIFSFVIMAIALGILGDAGSSGLSDLAEVLVQGEWVIQLVGGFIIFFLGWFLGKK